MPALISIFSPEILFKRVITPSSPITESLDPLLDKNQKSVPFTEATDTEVWTIKFLLFFT